MNKLNHIAFIMDGNGRWGKKKKKNRNFGHYSGVKTVKKIVEASIKLDIPIVTFYHNVEARFFFEALRISPTLRVFLTRVVHRQTRQWVARLLQPSQ